MKQRSRFDDVIGSDGCHLHDHCLTCPLPVCFYDEPMRHSEDLQAERLKRDAEIIAVAAAEKQPLDKLAAQFGVSRRTVTRALATANRGGNQ